MAGAMLLAMQNRYSGWGFVVYLVSNCFWITYAVLSEVPGLLFMQLAFTASSLLGIYRLAQKFRARKGPQ